MTGRSLVLGAICAVFCVAASAAFDSANAAKARKAACEPKLPGRICPPFQTSRCVPCKLKDGSPGCVWTTCSRIPQ